MRLLSQALACLGWGSSQAAAGHARREAVGYADDDGVPLLVAGDLDATLRPRA